jgi:hypothetical protein
MAEFVGRAPTNTYEYVLTELREGSGWTIKGVGDCQIKYLAEGLSTLSWWIDPKKLPKPTDRLVHIFAIDPCRSSALDGRVETPIIRSSSETVLVVLTATPGPATGDMCQIGPPTPLTIDLGEPVGHRALVDGGSWPSRDAMVAPAP